MPSHLCTALITISARTHDRQGCGLGCAVQAVASAVQFEVNLLLRLNRMLSAIAAKAAQLLRASIEPHAQHIEAQDNDIKKRSAQQEEGDCFASRAEGEPITRKPVQPITRPHRYPKPRILPSPGTHPPSVPSLARARRGTCWLRRPLPSLSDLKSRASSSAEKGFCLLTKHFLK